MNSNRNPLDIVNEKRFKIFVSFCVGSLCGESLQVFCVGILCVGSVWGFFVWVLCAGSVCGAAACGVLW